MKRHFLTTTAVLSMMTLQTRADAQLLGSAEAFAVLGGSTVTNTGSTVLRGDLGVWPGTALTGFAPIDGGPGLVQGSIYPGGATAQQAQADLTIAYTVLESRSFTQNLSGLDLGGMTLVPGIYHFDSSVGLTGVLTLDAQGDPNAQFEFQIGNTLISASSSAVHLLNGGRGKNVYWQVGSSATLGTSSIFFGHIIAMDSITLATNAVIVDGSALARSGAVTLDTNTVSSPTVVPEPTTVLALSAGLTVLARRRKRISDH